MWMAGAAVLLAAPLLAQPVAPDAAAVAPALTQARFQIRVMEGVLETAVQQGAQAVSTQMRNVSPDIALFSGPARARGFRLDGYGVFFAVDVPVLHRSVTWSVRTLSQSNADVTRAIQAIRRMVQAQNDARMKTELERALKLVELQVGPPALRAAASSVTAEQADTADIPPPGVPPRDVAPPPASAADETMPPPVITNPDAAYTAAVEDALIDAMLTYGPTLTLAPDEWLTVAARENADSILAGDLTETVTITLRVRAVDLDALKAGRLERADLRRRVEVRPF
jgi:hypothetical protein